MKLQYGWVVVAAGALLGCVAMGSTFSLAVFLQPKCGENRMGYCDESLEDWGKCPLGRVRPHKSALFELYERHGSRKAQALSEAEYRAVEEKEQL